VSVLDIKTVGITDVPVVKYFVSVRVPWVLAAASAGCLSPRDSRDNATVVETGHIILLGSSHLGDILGNACGCVCVCIVGASASPSTLAAAMATPSPLTPSMSLLEAPCMLLKPSILLLWDVDIGYWGYLYIAACRRGLIVDRECCELLHYGRLIRRELLDCC
jgi:hypothetical protein